MDDRAGLGVAGEKAAERFLRKRKLRTVTRNYRCPAGEIDLISLDGDTIVFVEVKTRTGREHADPEDAVNPGKQQRIRRSADFFLRQTGSEDRQYRFDIVAVIVDNAGELMIEHFPDAFTPSR